MYSENKAVLLLNNQFDWEGRYRYPIPTFYEISSVDISVGHFEDAIPLLEAVLVLAVVFVAVVVEGGAVALLDPLHPGSNVDPGLAVKGSQT